jgi:hypothetical protein
MPERRARRERKGMSMTTVYDAVILNCLENQGQGHQIKR